LTSLPLGRRLIRLTVDPPADADAAAPATPRRGYRRIAWIERSLQPLRDELTEEQFERLVSALALVVGWEAMIVLRDLRGLDCADEERVTTWAARVLVDAMRAEGRQAP
jgi:hypothetical protein